MGINKNADILIIGGGVIGLSIARELHKRGQKRITLVEKGVCGKQASWAAGGMLGPQAEADEGGAFFDFCSASRDLYPDFAAELLDETGIDVELDRSGTLSLAFTDDDVAELLERFRWQRKAGLAVEHLSAEAVRDLEPSISPDVRGALFFPNDWQVENRKLLAALRRYAELKGIEIVENTRVERLIVEIYRVTGADADDGRRFHAEHTMIATGAWTSLIKLGSTDMPFAVEPVRGQMICFWSEVGLFRHVIYSRRGYLVPRADGRVLAGSTSENVGLDNSVTDAATTALQTMAAEISPSLSGLPIADRWSGLRPMAADNMPVIGQIDGVDNLFMATAHYRNGILLAPLTAKLATEHLVGQSDSEYFRIFGPRRLGLRSVGTAGLW